MSPSAEIISNKTAQPTENKTSLGTVDMEEDVSFCFCYSCSEVNSQYKIDLKMVFLKCIFVTFFWSVEVYSDLAI